MNKHLQKILDGFLFGIGLSIPLAFAYGVLSYYTYDSVFSHNEVTELENYGLTFKEHRIEKAKDNAYIIGEIYNTNEITISSVNIMAEFRDDTGKFIDKCNATLNGVIKSNQTRSYKLECAPLLKPYSTYDLKIPSAYPSDLW